MNNKGMPVSFSAQIVKSRYFGGIFLERLYRRACNRDSQLHHREKSYGQTGRKKIWGFEIYDTYRCNKRGVFVKVVYEVR